MENPAGPSWFEKRGTVLGKCNDKPLVGTERLSLTRGRLSGGVISKERVWEDNGKRRVDGWRRSEDDLLVEIHITQLSLSVTGSIVASE